MTTTAAQPFDDVDHTLLAALKTQVPFDHRPFELLGRQVEIEEPECLKRIERLKDGKAIRAICALFDARTLGYQRTLTAMRVDPRRVDEAADVICRYPGVSYACQRNDPFNLWLTIAAPPSESIDHVVKILHLLAKADDTILLPIVQRYKSRGTPEGADPAQPGEDAEDVYGGPGGGPSRPQLSEQDVRFIRVLQEDLPLIEMPFAVLAEQANASEEELFAWARNAEHVGALRRYAALGSERSAEGRSSALVVWQVPSEQVDQIGRQMAQVRAVSRCEQRPVSAGWPYALFAMIQAESTAACMDVVRRIEEQVGPYSHKHLFTMKEYKKQRIQYFSPLLEAWWKENSLLIK